jgi:hypothetical protein
MVYIAKHHGCRRRWTSVATPPRGSTPALAIENRSGFLTKVLGKKKTNPMKYRRALVGIPIRTNSDHAIRHHNHP